MATPPATVNMAVPKEILDEIYIALNDSYERLPNGKMLIKRCLNFLENELQYEPPAGYVEKIEQEI